MLHRSLNLSFLVFLLVFTWNVNEVFPGEGTHDWEYLNNKIKSYSSNSLKPKFVIPFDKLGPRWKSWQKDKKKGRLGYYAKKLTSSIEIGVYPLGTDELIIEQGLNYVEWVNYDLLPQTQILSNSSSYKNLALGTMQLTSELVVPIHAQAPTADGSIIVFNTDGLDLIWLGGIRIISKENTNIYFGVIESLGGLVHLSGQGKCIFGLFSGKKEEIILK